MRLHTFTLSLTLALAADPALACHRFRTWHYPWPQRCRIVAGSHAREMARGPQAPSRRVALLVTPTVGTQGSSAIIVSPAGPTLDIPDKFPNFGSSREKAAIQLPTYPALPLPVLGPVEAVEAADETRARLMLRAVLGDPHAD